MSSTSSDRLAGIGEAIDKLAADYDAAGKTGQAGDIAERLAPLWVVLSDPAPDRARRLRVYAFPPCRPPPGPRQGARPSGHKKAPAAPASGAPGASAQDSGSDNLDFEGGPHLRVQPHRNLMSAYRLDRVGDLDLPLVQLRSARGLDGGGDVSRRHRAEQPPAAARAGLQPDRQGGEPVGRVPGIVQAADLARRAGPLDQVDLLLRAASPAHRQPARDQVVAAVDADHLDHVAGGTQTRNLLGQDELHGRTAHRLVPPCASACGAGVGQQRHLPRVLDRRGDIALVLRAVSGNPPCPDLATVRDELPQQPRVLVVHVGDLLLAEQADLLLRLANRWFCHRGAPWQSPGSRRGWSVCCCQAGLASPASEWRLVGESAVGRVRYPRVVGRTSGGSPTIPALAAGAGLAAAVATATRATPSAAGLGDLGRCVPQRGADLVDLYLVDGPLLAFLGLIGPLPQPALHDDAHAALQALGHVLGRLPPHVAGEEEAVAVLPLVGGPVHEPRRGGHAEVGHRLAGGGVAELRIVDEIAGDCDLGVACCHRGFSGRCDEVVGSGGRDRAYRRSGRRIFVRRTASLRLSWRSSSLTVSGSAVRSMTV